MKDAFTQYQHYPTRPDRLTVEFADAEYRKLVERIASAEAAESPDEWLRLYADWNSLRAYIGGDGSRTSYAFSRNMESPELEEGDRFFREEIVPVADRGNSALLNAVLVSRHRKAIAERYGDHLIRILQVSQEPLAPINTELRVKAGSRSTRYSKIVASGEVMVRGEKMTLPMAASAQVSEDAGLRREAFIAQREWFLAHREEISGIFDELVQLRDQMGRNLGHENFIPLGYLGMGRTDYGPAEVEQFRDNVRRYAVPLQQKLFERQARELGTETLKPWDAAYDPTLTLPSGVAPIDTQLEKAQRVFDALSTRLGAHFMRMREEGLIDLENRRGKRAGAFCTTFADEPRTAILCNSTGDQEDVRTLMHEMGHAFQKWESFPIKDVLLQRPTSDVAEVHSMGMEYLSMRHMTEFFSEEDATKFRRGRWKKAIELLCYVSIVDEFQHWVYANPTATPEERDQAWSRIWDVYKPGIDFTGVEAYKYARWYAQGHIFGMPFYYIDYAIAETGAMQLALIDAEDHERAMDTYMKLCRIGGTNSVLNIFDEAGLRSPFSAEVMRDLMAHAAKELGAE